MRPFDAGRAPGRRWREDSARCTAGGQGGEWALECDRGLGRRGSTDGAQQTGGTADRARPTGGTTDRGHRRLGTTERRHDRTGARPNGGTTERGHDRPGHRRPGGQVGVRRNDLIS
jgi:hypothetical protein